MSRFGFATNRTLIVSAIIAGLCGLISFSAPLDLAFSAASNKIRMAPASGDVVVVSLDDYASENNFVSQVPSVHGARIIDTLLESGASRVLFSMPVESKLVEHMHAVDRSDSLADGRIYFVEPLNGLGQFEGDDAWARIGMGNIAHNEKHIRYWGGSERVAYSLFHKGQSVPSAESVLSGVYQDSSNFFHIDYGIDVSTIPNIQFEENGRGALGSAVAGKSVIVGYELRPYASDVRILGKPGVFGEAALIALGAETLIRGPQHNAGWIWSWLFGVMLSVVISRTRRVWQQCALFTGGVFALFGLLTFFNSVGVFGTISEALLILVPVFCGSVFGAVRRSNPATEVDLQSGLPSLNALKCLDARRSVLVVAKLKGFEELMDILSVDQRTTLIAKIVSLLNNGSDVWHGNDGRFYWFLNEQQDQPIGAHLEGLSVIFRNGFSIGSYPFSLPVVFGVDRRIAEPISERVITCNAALNKAVPVQAVWVDYEETDRAEVVWNMTAVAELRRAMADGVIYAALQPKINLIDDVFIGVEALARWEHPTRGFVPPPEFVAVAERSGLLKELTLCVLRSALATASDALAQVPNLKIAVNVSNTLICDDTFCDAVLTVLDEYGVEPSSLILEITEGSAFEDFAASVIEMNKMVDLGITLSIDDYGTGNSTLEFLRSIPAAELKIDKKFVDGLGVGEADVKLVQSTIGLAKELGMVVVAEGIETKEALDQLVSLGCSVGQGYYLSKPLSAVDFADFVRVRRLYELTKNTGGRNRGVPLKTG